MAVVSKLSNSDGASSPLASSNPSAPSSQFGTPSTSFIKGMSKSPSTNYANSSPITSHHSAAADPESEQVVAVKTGITNKTKHLDIWRTSLVLASDFGWICGLLSFFSSSVSLAPPPPPSQASTMMDSSHPITAVDPESAMGSEQVVTNKTKHLDIGTSVVLASDFAWICGLLFSSDATKTKMMATYRDLLIVITIIIIFSLCIGLIAFLISVTFPIASRAMKVITITAGIVGAILSTFMIFLVLRL